MNGKCAGLKVIKSSLSANRMELVRSMVDRGPYGQIEDWNGEVIVEITSACHMSEDACIIVAGALANDEMDQSVFVEEWDFKIVGRLIHMTPKAWTEIDPDSHFRRDYDK